MTNKFFSLVSFLLIGACALCFIGCSGGAELDKLKAKNAEQAAEIERLNSALSQYVDDNDSYTTDDGHTITIIGGKVDDVSDNYITIRSLSWKIGFSVWKKGNDIVSAENYYKIDKDLIGSDVTYTALYNCIGVGVVAGSVANTSNEAITYSALRSSYGSLFEAKYSFAEEQSTITSSYTTNSGIPNIKVRSDEFVASPDLECFTVSTNESSVRFFKIFLPDDTNPYEIPEAIEEEELEEGQEQPTAFNDDKALVYFVNRQEVTSNKNASLNVSFSNQKTDSSREEKQICIVVKKS